MAVIYLPDGHVYKSCDTEESINWTSVTKFIGNFKPKFDAKLAAYKASHNSKSKWYRKTPEEIMAIWDKEKDRSINTGTNYHEQRELDTLGISSIQREGLDLPIIAPIIKEGVKYAPLQKLTPGIYPEHFMYLKSAGICGQADRVEAMKDKIHVFDYKTNKEIKKEGYKQWNGVVQKMLGPCAHLDDCNYNHYALQLSTYMYMILKHNPSLEPGDLVLQHVIFKKESDDENGYPIYMKDINGNPVVHEVVLHKLPYLKTEVINMIDWFKYNER